MLWNVLALFVALETFNNGMVDAEYHMTSKPNNNFFFHIPVVCVFNSSSVLEQAIKKGAQVQ